MNTDYEYKIIKDYGFLSEISTTGYVKRLCIMQWGIQKPKFDLRLWRIIRNPETGEDTQTPCKGISLTQEEIKNLYTIMEQAQGDQTEKSEVVESKEK